MCDSNCTAIDAAYALLWNQMTVTYKYHCAPTRETDDLWCRCEQRYTVYPLPPED